ncbi:MAG: FAD/NAD(P)-binding protein [Bacillota bacterium]
MNSANPLLPQQATILDITEETPDIRTLRVGGKDGLPFEFMPGQCAMLSVPPIGEAIFSITSSPSCQECLEFSIKNVGSVSEALHQMQPGQQIGIRGPYGNGFPVDKLRGKDLLFIGGGIGLAPLRSLIGYCFDHREDYGHIDIVYGARTPADLIRKAEIKQSWREQPATNVYLTVDVEHPDWDENVGLVPHYVTELGFTPENKIAVTCGPPIMIKFTLKALNELQFSPDQVFTTLEMRMKCGIGKCGRCNLGPIYVCKDGPVFSLAELNALPAEY